MESAQDECSVCLDRAPDVQFSGCRHCCCLPCAVQLTLCPLCRAPIRHRVARQRDANEALVAQLAAVPRFAANDVLHSAIAAILKGSDTRRTAALIYELAAEIGGYLSLAQTEALLIKAQEHGLLDYRIQNSLVRLCNQPWLVSRQLGGCGICYYGNFGETPWLQDAIALLTYNRKASVGLQ
jgi:hypothetical protein